MHPPGQNREQPEFPVRNTFRFADIGFGRYLERDRPDLGGYAYRESNRRAAVSGERGRNREGPGCFPRGANDKGLQDALFGHRIDHLKNDLSR